MIIGFGFGWVMIAIDEMLKGFSLRAFSATTFGLLLGSVVALLIDRSGLFEFKADETTRWLIRLCLFLSFGYIGIVLAMRSNKEDFSLIIPYVRFTKQNQPDNLLLLDTSVVIDGRIADLIEANFLEGIIVVPRFVLKELQQIADSKDPIKRARGRRGLEILSRIQKNSTNEVKIHDGDFPDEGEVDSKLIRLARADESACDRGFELLNAVADDVRACRRGQFAEFVERILEIQGRTGFEFQANEEDPLCPLRCCFDECLQFLIVTPRLNYHNLRRRKTGNLKICIPLPFPLRY